MPEIEQIRWMLMVTWRDAGGRDWSEPVRLFSTLDAARKAHTDAVIEHKDGRTERRDVHVHRLAKWSKVGDADWSPAGWDQLCGDVCIRWPESARQVSA